MEKGGPIEPRPAFLAKHRIVFLYVWPLQIFTVEMKFCGVYPKAGFVIQSLIAIMSESFGFY